jgi:signal transduction histidine kinase
MDVFHDYGLTAKPDSWRRAGEQDEQLLICFQKALGHELPNKLVALGGLARLVQEEYSKDLGPEGQALLERLAAAAQRADGLVRRLAEIGRLCRAGGEEGVRFEEVAHEARAELIFLGCGATIEYDLSLPLPVLKIARAALHQVLLQLIHNAVQAAEGTRPLKIVVGGHGVPGGLEFWVADNGRGIAGSSAAQLFQPFSKGIRGEGWGLGLFLVRQLVARWAGAIQVHSEEGKGAVVTVRLPAEGSAPSGS